MANHRAEEAAMTQDTSSKSGWEAVVSLVDFKFAPRDVNPDATLSRFKETLFAVRDKEKNQIQQQQPLF